MVDAVSFRARARTIDHLGREQIADCPTAVSELWKNAYDAYARTVALNIYDDEPPIATVADDGHGMSREDFVRHWLEVGTESKATGSQVPPEHRNGLPPRSRQGQKGIGRLSSAALGPLLLIVSKRRDAPFVAGLIDWRLFENPFLYLEDIEIPVVDVDAKDDLFGVLPGLFDRLMGNLWGTSEDNERNQRLSAAWQAFDDLEADQDLPSTRSAIESVVIDTAFKERHFGEWPLWRDEAETGTILAVSDIQFDLLAQLDRQSANEPQGSVKLAQDRLFHTLSQFTDPYVDESEADSGFGSGDFFCSVTAWEGSLRRPIISEERQFGYRNLEKLEHVVEGEVDEQGTFHGRVRAFGEWRKGEIRIPPTFQVPTRSNSWVGPFHLRIGTFEQLLRYTSHSEEVFRRLDAQADKYSGLMIYRNGLRVMPYGREDNDFFEIEKRRSLHAGREFWSTRRLFGRVAIRRAENPNLKDKAGREGLIDNKAGKIFRDLVINILQTTGRKYFGTDSEDRKRHIPERKEEYVRRKAEEARDRERAKRRSEFRSRLKHLAPELAERLNEVETLADRVRSSDLTSEAKVLDLREGANRLKRELGGFVLGEAPRKMTSSLEKVYAEYRHNRRRSDDLIADIGETLKRALDEINPRSPRDIVLAELNANATFLQQRLRKWSAKAASLLESERRRLDALHKERSAAYRELMLPLVEDVSFERLSLNDALAELEREREKQDFENAELFEPYISALQSLANSIDLVTLAGFGMDEAEELRAEIDRLHALAQLGITVEIIGHEIEGLEHAITAALKRFPESMRSIDAYRIVKENHEALIDRLRFLSPLKLSGEKSKAELSGRSILEYIQQFFGDSLSRNGLKLDASQSFLAFSVHELPSRIYPVFINLVNNAAYWVRQTSQGENRILLDAVDGKVIVADDGPGVEEDDLKQLFTLFFTRKVRGGRGVGLYLCRANLAAGGHNIEYTTEERLKRLPGANFAIDFKGARYD